MCLLGRGRTLSVNTLKLYHTSGSNHFAPSISDIEAIVGSGRFAGGGAGLRRDRQDKDDPLVRDDPLTGDQKHWYEGSASVIYW